MRFAGGICFVLSCVVMFGAQGKIADDDPFFDRFRYGLEVIRRLFGAESTSHFAAFFSPFKNRSASVSPKFYTEFKFYRSIASKISRVRYLFRMNRLEKISPKTFCQPLLSPSPATRRKLPRPGLKSPYSLRKW